MSDPIAVLPLDLTGVSPENLIQGEEHSPAAGTTRLIIPRFGAFYAKSLQVFDAVTGDPVAAANFKCADIWQKATEESSETVATVIVLYAGAPASVALTYQAFGGPASRNAQVLLEWFNDKVASNAATLDFSELKDFPDKVDPSHHLHLASHLYGMEFITDALARLSEALTQGGHDSREHTKAFINNRIRSLYDRTIATVSGIVQEAFYKWRDEINLFYLGCDQLTNMGMITKEEAAASVSGSFVVQNPEDDRYVNLSGLGEFCKGMAERLLLQETGLGAEYAVMRDPHRGSLLTAKVGSVFMVPSQNEAINISHRYKEVYPKDYPLDVPMIVEKVGAHPRDRAGLFIAYHPTLGHSWVGLLIDSRFTTRIEWFRRYFRDEQMDLEKMLADHEAATGNVHQETKEQLGFGNVENLPVVTVDDILSETPADKMHTMATLLYAMRAWLENVKLPLGDNGEVDMSTNPLTLPKVIFAPCTNADGIGSIEFVESFCDGSDKYAKWTNGKGGYEDKLVELNSDDCKYVKIPEIGTSLGKYCDPVTKNMMDRIADGRGGSKSEIVSINDPACGYVKPQEAGTKLFEFCSGVNMVARYADGKGGYNDVPILINTVKCDGENFETPGTGGTTPGSGSKAKIVLSSTHTKLYQGTFEIMVIAFSGLQPNTQYEASLYAQSPALWEGIGYEMLKIPFRSGSTGGFIKELPITDDGVTPRGVYDNWVVMLSENLESNHITRTFLAGDPPPGGTDPENPDPRPDGKPPGTGDTDEEPSPTAPKPIDIDGNPYGEGPWPPRPAFNPQIILSTNKPIIYPGDNETQSVMCSGFMAGQAYTLRYYFTSTAYNNGARIESFTVNFVADYNGKFAHTLHLYDDGTLPRGTYVCTAEVDNYSSPSIVRTFMATNDGGVKPKPSPSIVYTCSHTSIVKGTVYTETVVLSGMEPGTKYSIAVKAGYFDGAIMGYTRHYFVLTTDANGSARWENTTTDDGVTVARSNYRTQASVAEVFMISAVVFINYMAGIEVGTPGTALPKLDYTSTLSRINPGDTETQTVTLSNGKPATQYVIEWWIKSPSLNNNQDFMSTTTTITTDALGSGKAILTTTDNGTTVPRGDYQCWAVCSVLDIRSTSITRTFLSGTTTPAPTTPPTLKDALLTFSTSHPTIQKGVVETMTAALTKFIPNTDYSVELWIKSSALANGGQPVKTATLTCKTDGNGNATATLTMTDDGTAPRGEYQCWAVCSTITSNTIIRNFVGTTVVYNPVLTYSTNLSTITLGSTETQTISLTKAQPNTAYTLEYWTQSPVLMNGAAFRGTTRSVVTDSNGSASTSIQTYDDGVVPRGTYSSWARCPELNLTSNYVTRVFQGTPAPTEPPFNPVVSYWTDRSQLWPGVYETHTITIGGMRANTSYNVQVWVQSPALWGGVASHMKTVMITTNNTGNGGTSWSQYDDGITPRGTYANWAVIAETGTSSSAFTRVFV